MEEKKDYYKILGVSDEEKKLHGEEFKNLINKKYKKLAIKWHPDKWATASEEEKKTAEDKFKEISEAKEVLSDENKRAQYDNGGFEFNSAGFDPMDMFKNMHSPFGGFGDFFHGFGRQEQQVVKGSNVHVVIDVTLKEAFNGCDKEIKYNRMKPCSHCNGTGSSDGKTATCPRCHGSGMVQEVTRQGANFTSVVQHICPECGGTGKKITSPCSYCHGTGFENDLITQKIQIPKGVTNGAMLSINGAGNAPEGGQGINGDAIIEIHVLNDDYYQVSEKDGLSLVHYDDVPVSECLLGFEKEYQCIDGSTVKVKAPELTNDGAVFVYKGKGMPYWKNPSVYGNFAIIIRYKLPKKLSKKQKELLKEFGKEEK